MTRRIIVLGLSLSLLTAISGPAATAAPVPFTTTGSIATSDVVDAWIVGPTSVTVREFAATCAIPTTQGFDAFVIELPSEMSRAAADVRVDWSAAASAHNVHMWFANARCGTTGHAGAYNSVLGETHEEGTFPRDTKYVLVIATLGAALDFTFTATPVR